MRDRKTKMQRQNPFLTESNAEEEIYTLANDDEEATFQDNLLINTPNSNQKSNQKSNQPHEMHENIFTGAWLVSILSIIILAILIYGLFQLYNTAEIIYGEIGSCTFQIYYIINVCWYTVFLIIHLFLVSTQLFYTMNKTNYINHIILNYSHIRYSIFIKILFMLSLSVIIFLNNYAISLLPLYYNLIVIEIILSITLMLFINMVMQHNTIMHDTILHDTILHSPV